MSKSSVPFGSMLKVVAVISSPALFILALYVVLGVLDVSYFLYAYLGIMIASAFFVHPFLANVSSLTAYVKNLSQDKRVDAPDLSFLSMVGELSEALSILNRSWEKKRLQMESVITEREILVDTLPDILIMINDDKMVVRTNRAARLIFGQNLAHHHLRDVIPSDGLLRAVSAVMQDLRGREVEFHLDMQSKSYEFLAIIERFPIPSVGGISTIIALNDITERKRSEQMRADFVANASHEIRTPLASIKGFIETLQGPAKDDAGARDEFLKVMAEQADRMTRLISDLLSLSKIEMNAHSLPEGKVDMLRVIRGEAQNFERAAVQKGMTIKLELHDNLPLVRGEQNELVQVMHNLIGNAVKYGYADSDIHVQAKATNLLPPDPVIRHHTTRMVCVTVKDRGDGIPKEHLPRLTERFYRVDSARTRSVGGTGLGLAIVKHILNRHQGALTIDSAVGEGSVFGVYLPIYEE